IAARLPICSLPLDQSGPSARWCLRASSVKPPKWISWVAILKLGDFHDQQTILVDGAHSRGSGLGGKHSCSGPGAYARPFQRHPQRLYTLDFHPESDRSVRNTWPLVPAPEGKIRQG